MLGLIEEASVEQLRDDELDLYNLLYLPLRSAELSKQDLQDLDLHLSAIRNAKRYPLSQVYETYPLTVFIGKHMRNHIGDQEAINNYVAMMVNFELLPE